MGRTALPPEKKRKADNDRNAEGLDEAIARHMKKERRLYPLKINANTYIYVPKKKDAGIRRPVARADGIERMSLQSKDNPIV